jgi:UDP-N-acetylglucosamine enolpyruvyl transferase
VAAPLTVTVSQRADLTDEYKHMPGLTVAATTEAIVADGLATAETVAEAVARLAEYADDPHTMIGSPRMFQVSARKPAP